MPKKLQQPLPKRRKKKLLGKLKLLFRSDSRSLKQNKLKRKPIRKPKKHKKKPRKKRPKLRRRKESLKKSYAKLNRPRRS